MEITYQESMAAVYRWEGGYSNDAGDDGGPTDWGITIDDARHWWKPDATAADVRAMPQSVAADIYAKRYAAPLHYNDLPAGVDLATLDYGINSGIHRAAAVLQGIVGTHADGIIGPLTLAACDKLDPAKVVNAIYDQRLAFLHRARNKAKVSLWNLFGTDWQRRCNEGRALALEFITKYPAQPKGIIVATTTTTTTTSPIPTVLPSLEGVGEKVAEAIEASIVAACTARNPLLGAIVRVVLDAGIKNEFGSVADSVAPAAPSDIIHTLAADIGAIVSKALAKAKP